jgi:hypothetical protein
MMMLATQSWWYLVLRGAVIILFGLFENHTARRQMPAVTWRSRCRFSRTCSSWRAAKLPRNRYLASAKRPTGRVPDSRWLRWLRGMPQTRSKARGIDPQSIPRPSRSS